MNIETGVIDVSLGAGVARVLDQERPLRGRGLEIVALLALNRRPLSTDAILDAIWPDDDPFLARACFKVHVCRLRDRLGSRTALVFDGQRWRLGPGVHTDVAAWHDLVAVTRSSPMTQEQHIALEAAWEALINGPAPCLSTSRIWPHAQASFAALLFDVERCLGASARRDEAAEAS
jgi:hypothetical protein